jgi:hypothetical protein
MVAMVALVEGLQAQEVRRGRVGGDRAMSLPGDGGGIVGARVGGALTDVGEVDVGVLLYDGGGKFEIRHAHVAGGVGLGHQSGTQGRRKGGAPQGGGRISSEGKHDAAHAQATGIVGARHGRRKLDELLETGRACRQVVLEPLEVGQGIVDAAVEANAGRVAKGEL